MICVWCRLRHTVVLHAVATVDPENTGPSHLTTCDKPADLVTYNRPAARQCIYWVHLACTSRSCQALPLSDAVNNTATQVTTYASVHMCVRVVTICRGSSGRRLETHPAMPLLHKCLSLLQYRLPCSVATGSLQDSQLALPAVTTLRFDSARVYV